MVPAYEGFATLGPHLRLAQLSDKVGILAVSVSCSLVFKKGVFRFEDIPYTVVGHFCMRIFRIPSVYNARDFTRAVTYTRMCNG